MLKQSLVKFKFDCKICSFKTNNEKEFREHISYSVHVHAAMKYLKNNLNL